MSQAGFFGHDALRAALLTASRRGELPATLLIHGIPGCGKQTLAHWLAQVRLCGADEEGPCGICQSCRFVARFEHPDVHWHFPLPRPKNAGTPEKLADALESARQERLADLRSDPLKAVPEAGVKGLYLAQVLAIRRAAHKRPSMGAEQVFIIADAEYLVPQEASPEAANALLKLLEEPPDGSRFILTSSRPESLLETIRSRALAIHLPPLGEVELVGFLEARADVSPAQAREAARFGQGSIGRALAFLQDGGAAPERRAEALALLRAATAGDRGELYRTALSYGPAGARGLLELLADLQHWIRDLSAAGLGQVHRAADQAQGPFLERMAGDLEVTPELAARAVDRVEQARILAEANVNPQLLLASLLLDLDATFQRASES